MHSNFKYLKQILELIEEGKCQNITEVFSKVFGRNLEKIYNSLVKLNDDIYILILFKILLLHSHKVHR